MDYAIWGTGSAAGFHLSNLLLHLLITSLLFVLLSRRFSQRAAFWAAMLFGVHPVHAECIVPAMSRDNMLVGLSVAVLLAFEFSRIRRPARGLLRGGAAWLAALIFVATMLSKESALVFPLVLGAYAFCYFIPFSFGG